MEHQAAEEEVNGPIEKANGVSLTETQREIENIKKRLAELQLQQQDHLKQQNDQQQQRQDQQQQQPDQQQQQPDQQQQQPDQQQGDQQQRQQQDKPKQPRQRQSEKPSRCKPKSYVPNVQGDAGGQILLQANGGSSVEIMRGEMIRLDEKNYCEWRKSMQLALKSSNLLALVEGSFPRPISCPKEKFNWDKANSNAIIMITESIPDEILEKLKYPEWKYAHEWWERINDLFSEKKKPSKLDLLIKWYTFKYPPSGKFDEYVKTLLDLRDFMKSENILRDDEEVVAKISIDLPTQYKSFVTDFQANHCASDHQSETGANLSLMAAFVAHIKKNIEASQSTPVSQKHPFLDDRRFTFNRDNRQHEGDHYRPPPNRHVRFDHRSNREQRRYNGECDNHQNTGHKRGNWSMKRDPRYGSNK